ncbi:MAG: hypothetical protein DRI61_10645, partial [Chloroflexi bacterium]
DLGENVEGFINDITGVKTPFENIRDNAQAAIDGLGNVGTSIKDFLGQALEVEEEVQDDRIFDGVLDEYATLQDDLGDIQTDAAEERIAAEEEHEARRTEIVEEFARKRTQAVQDENIRRARSAQDLERSIGKERLDAQHKERDAINDFNEKMRKMRIDAQEQIVEARDDFQKSEIKRAKEHTKRLKELNRSLEEASASLDAVAVDRIQKQIDSAEEGFSEETDERQREQSERISIIQKETDERIAEEQRGLDQQIAELKTSSNRKIEEMRSNAAIEEQRRAEDFALRMAREDERHMLELAREDQRFIAEQAKIDQREIEMLAAREEKFVEWYNKAAEEAGVHSSNMLKIQQQGEEALERGFLNFWNRTRIQQINQMAGQANYVQRAAQNLVSGITGIASSIRNVFSRISGRASGGPVAAMRPYVVGERGPELFVPRSSGAIIPSGAMTSGVNIGNVSMNFPGITDQSNTDQIQRVVYREFDRVFLAGGA